MILQITFGDTSDRAPSKALLSHDRMIVSGHYDDRQLDLSKRQEALDITSSELRHLKIQYHAVRSVSSQGVDKLLAGGERQNVEIGTTQQPR